MVDTNRFWIYKHEEKMKNDFGEFDHYNNYVELYDAVEKKMYRIQLPQKPKQTLPCSINVYDKDLSLSYLKHKWSEYQPICKFKGISEQECREAKSIWLSIESMNKKVELWIWIDYKNKVSISFRELRSY